MKTGTTVTHWGAYEVDTHDGEVVGIRPFAKDPDPSAIGASLSAVTRSRVAAPSIRKSWLEGGPGTRTDLRGVEPFIEVDWDTAYDLVATELDRIRTTHGNQAIFGGSYGWASAGRFHHAQSQLHRFLTVIGGYTSKRDTYSHAAGEVIVPHVLGYTYDEVQAAHTSVQIIAEQTDLFVSFGGVPMKNAQVQNGGMGRHTLRGWLHAAKDRGTRFVNISPIRDDVMDELEAEWIAPRPGTDVAVMLALIYVLVETGQADEAFLTKYCVGWPELRASIIGEDGSIAKTPEWAASVADIDPNRLRLLAADLVQSRSIVNIAWGLQRADHGEQTWWALIALAAAIGQIGLPGGGFGLGYGAVAGVGNGATRKPFPAFGRGVNPVADFIPVSRIADMLLQPGARFTYNGHDLDYPTIELIYWCGGNPFHHHQDLNRLNEAWRRPATVIVNEPFWTATAKRSDVVLPCTTPLERSDIGGSPREDFLFAMQPVLDPVGLAKADYEIFSQLAERLGAGTTFTEGRSAAEWIRHLYDRFQAEHPEYPQYDEFVEAGFVQHRETSESLRILLDDFRADPERHPLRTPSGRIELYSGTIADFGYEDCPPLPAFLEPHEWLGDAERYPLHLISNQPATRLHSQLDHGVTSTERKIGGREVVRMHPSDAGARNLAAGDVARIFNDRGACFASVEVSDRLRPRVVELPTGAWWDPLDPANPTSPCRHGNPNVLTRDEGTSSLAQGPVAQSCLVEIEPAVDAPTPDPFSGPKVVPLG